MERKGQMEFSALIRASTVSTIALTAVSTPLDTARRSAQACLARRRPAPGFISSLRSAAGAAQGGGAIVSVEGLAMWRGRPWALGYAALSPAVFVFAYEFQKGSGMQRDAMKAAFYARMLQVMVAQPIDFMRSCQQSTACLPPAEARHLMRTSAWEIMSADGFRSMYRGLIPTLMRDAPAAFLYLQSFRLLRQQLPSMSEPEPVGNDVGASTDSRAYCETAACSGGCAALAAFATQPFDVVKTRMQAFQLIRTDQAGYKKYTQPRVIRTFKEVFQMAGVRGLWIGGTARCLQATLFGIVLGPLFEFNSHIEVDTTRPVRRQIVDAYDPTKTIVHPRSTRSNYW